MTELEKLRAGLEYDMTDPEVDGLKLRAVKLCQKLNNIDVTDYATKTAAAQTFGNCKAG